MKDLRASAAVCAVLVCLSAVTAPAQDYDNDYDVPYVPTKYPVVDAMLTIAGVNGFDMLYDLGCGDGRIVVTAAARFGTRGLGIDINPVRIAESRENAEKEGVTERVRFIEQDLFETDISGASVVTLYLLPSVNLRLRPKLFSDLKPGTRVVSHDFDMDEWKPDRELVVKGEDADYDYRSHRVFFWVIPGNVSGEWSWPSPEGFAGDARTLIIGQRFQEVALEMRGFGDEQPVDVELNGDRLRFVMNEARMGGGSEQVIYSGAVTGDILRGTIITGDSTIPWRAERLPGTMKPLETAAGE